MSKQSMCATCQAKTTEIVHMCDFCGRNEHQVETMVAGNGVDICSHCVATCQEIIIERAALRAGAPV